MNHESWTLKKKENQFYSKDQDGPKYFLIAFEFNFLCFVCP